MVVVVETIKRSRLLPVSLLIAFSISSSTSSGPGPVVVDAFVCTAWQCRRVHSSSSLCCCFCCRLFLHTKQTQTMLGHTGRLHQRDYIRSLLPLVNEQQALKRQSGLLFSSEFHSAGTRELSESSQSKPRWQGIKSHCPLRPLLIDITRARPCHSAAGPEAAEAAAVA